MVRTTRKAGKRTSDSMSVEGLHSSFEKIDGKIRSLVQKGASTTELAACIRRSWAHHFQRPVSEAAVKGLVTHYRAMYTGAKKTRKNRGQAGGMAPLDYQLGQGTAAVPYGIFPSEMGRVAVSALDNERFFESPVGRHCNTTGGMAAPSQTGGGEEEAPMNGSSMNTMLEASGGELNDVPPLMPLANTINMAGGKRRTRRNRQKGGSLWDSLVNGHAPASVPRNVVESTVSAVQGAPIFNPNPDPVAHSWTMAQNPIVPYDTTQIHQFQTLAPVYTGYNN